MNKRKIFKISIISGLVVFFGCMSVIITRQLVIRKEAAEKIHDIPQFKFYSLSGQNFTQDSVAAGKAVIIIHFSPDCENCQDEAKELQGNISALGDVQVLMIAEADKDEVEKFFGDYKLAALPQIKPLLDKDGAFFKAFGMVLNPLVFVYDREHKLVKFYKGQTKVDAISKVLKQG